MAESIAKIDQEYKTTDCGSPLNDNVIYKIYDL